MTTRSRPVLLIADDYAMTAGISESILVLASAGRLSGTSAMTNTRHWPAMATKLAAVRGNIATGVHLNLTLGRPLGSMPRFAPDGVLPSIGDVTARALTGRLHSSEIEDEFGRQLDAFTNATGTPPDHVDGHQHVHALPVVRDALMAALSVRFGTGITRHQLPLVRDPAETIARIAARGRCRAKAMSLAALAAGFGKGVRALGYPVNEGFSGVTSFDPAETAADFAAAVTATGPRHLVMCHPGFVDLELRELDPVTDRRKSEHEALMGGAFPSPIWRPDRAVEGPPIAWDAAWP